MGKSEKKRVFSKDLRPMLYGFGDSINPLGETVDIVEDCVTEYLSRLLNRAMRFAYRGGSDKVKTEDLMQVLKRDSKKYGRMEELLFMNEELKRVRKAFDPDE
jgi:transcription initiation factor TFIID subunit 13